MHFDLYIHLFIDLHVYISFFMGQRAEWRQINKKKHDIANINDQATASVSECN